MTKIETARLLIRVAGLFFFGFARRAGHGVSNIAPTGSLLFMTIEHVGSVSGTQFVDQPPNVDPGEGTAVSVTVVPTT